MELFLMSGPIVLVLINLQLRVMKELGHGRVLIVLNVPVIDKFLVVAQAGATELVVILRKDSRLVLVIVQAVAIHPVVLMILPAVNVVVGAMELVERPEVVH